jgi:hypothetical protein
MIPNFTVGYRAPGIVDLLIPKQEGVESYVIKASSKTAGPPVLVTLLTVGIGVGYLDPSIDRNRLHTMPGTNRVRVVFNPSTYAAGGAIDAGLVDTEQFWLVVQPVSGGVPGVDSPAALVRGSYPYDYTPALE